MNFMEVIMKRFVTKLTGLLLVLAMSAAVFAACDASDPGYGAPDMNLASPYYPEENGIISPNSQSGIVESLETHSRDVSACHHCKCI